SVIGIGLERRADPVDLGHGNAGSLQAKRNSPARQLAARVLGERETLLLGGGDQLAVAQQDGAAIVMAVLDPRAYSDDVHGQDALEFANEVDDLVLLLPRDLSKHRK